MQDSDLGFNSEDAHDYQIVPFSSEHRDRFWEINASWIERFFTIEPIDEQVLKNPETEILEKGGMIFFAQDSQSGEVVGTCGLIFHGGEWELAKMGVDPRVQGRGLGLRLATAIIEFARSQGIPRLVLETNSTLKSAIRLYERLGFVQVGTEHKSDYIRSDVKMQLNL